MYFKPLILKVHKKVRFSLGIQSSEVFQSWIAGGGDKPEMEELGETWAFLYYYCFVNLWGEIF